MDALQMSKPPNQQTTQFIQPQTQYMSAQWQFPPMQRPPWMGQPRPNGWNYQPRWQRPPQPYYRPPWMMQQRFMAPMQQQQAQQQTQQQAQQQQPQANQKPQAQSDTSQAAAQQLTCRRCNMTGHKAMNCPTMICYACNTAGHMASVCPNNTNGYSCYKCATPGVLFRSCPTCNPQMGNTQAGSQ